MQLKRQAVRSLGVTAALSELDEGAFTLSPSAPLVKNRAMLNFYRAEVVSGEGWARFGSNTPETPVDVFFLNVTNARRYLLDLAVIPLGGTIIQRAARAGQIRERTDRDDLVRSNHVLFAVEVTSANSGIEIACDSDYQFHSCEITPLPDG